MEIVVKWLLLLMRILFSKKWKISRITKIFCGFCKKKCIFSNPRILGLPLEMGQNNYILWRNSPANWGQILIPDICSISVFTIFLCKRKWFSKLKVQSGKLKTKCQKEREILKHRNNYYCYVLWCLRRPLLTIISVYENILSDRKKNDKDIE